MTSAPAVSVLLPVRDGAATLEAALESLSVQTLRDHEVIVVDDGSRDATAALVRARAAIDPRVRLFSQPPRGIVSALEHAAAQARGSLWARMDADDLCHPERLARQVSWLRRRSDLVAVGSLVESFGEHPPSEGWRRYESWLNRRCTAEQIARDLLVESPLAHPSVMLRAAALRAVGGYRDFDGPEDYDLWLRLARAGGRFAKVPRVLLRWRDHAGRLTRTDGRYRPDAFVRLKVEHLRAGLLAPPVSREVVLWGAGRDGGRCGRELLAQGVALAAFVDVDPRRVGSSRHGCPVWSPAMLAARNAHYARPLVLAVVGVERARAQIRRHLARRGYREGEDFVVCA